MPIALDLTFGALADPTRRAILARLTEGNATVLELAKPFRTSLPGVMKHLRKLESAGLVVSEKRGRDRHCRLAVKPLKEAVDWLSSYEKFWVSQFDRLADHLESKHSKQKGTKS